MKKGILVLAFLLVGCSNPMTLLASRNDTVSIQVRPCFAEDGYRTQGDVSNYTKNSINHLVLELSKDGNPVLNGGNPLVKDILFANLSQTVTLTNLKANATYRILCKAYKATGTNVNDLISTDASFVDVAVGTNDFHALASIPVFLIDTPFVGQATGSISVTDGNYSTANPEAFL